jgi:hypothetical protein
MATAAQPALIIFVIDISGSMAETVGDDTKIALLNIQVREVLRKLVQLATKGEIIAPRYRLAMLAYSDCVISVLNGVEAISDIVKRGMPIFSPAATSNAAMRF